MANFQPQYDVVVRRGHGSLPIDLKFECLAGSRGVETLRIRFSLGPDRVLDLPLSAETLADLANALTPLHRIPPTKIPEELADLQQKGLRLRD